MLSWNIYQRDYLPRSRGDKASLIFMFFSCLTKKHLRAAAMEMGIPCDFNSQILKEKNAEWNVGTYPSGAAF
jgi:hypothetical protein